MKTRPLMVMAIVMSCQNQQSANEPTGVYVRAYSFEISNLQTGRPVGIREVRDSIFIEKSYKGYLVRNHKWRKNDYDQEGWMSMEHSDNRPMRPFVARFDMKTQSLQAEHALSAGLLYVDITLGRLYRDKSKDRYYRKLK
jgi:hypothetical protein